MNKLNICIKITKNEKKFVKKIHEIYLPQENYSFIKVAFYTWLTDNICIIYLNKNSDNTWNYVFASENNPYTDRIIINMSTLLNSN